MVKKRNFGDFVGVVQSINEHPLGGVEIVWLTEQGAKYYTRGLMPEVLAVGDQCAVYWRLNWKWWSHTEILPQRQVVNSQPTTDKDAPCARVVQ